MATDLEPQKTLHDADMHYSHETYKGTYIYIYIYIYTNSGLNFACTSSTEDVTIMKHIKSQNTGYI